MFTDIVGYSALTQADEADALKLLERHNRLLRPIFSRFDGREVKTIGDAFLVEFESALEGVRCAIEIQRSLHEYNGSPPDGRKIRIRVGLHVGDVVQSDGDVLGDAVNIASRIEPLAEPDGICLTQQVYDQVQNKLSVPLVKLSPVALKNIQFPMSVYRVVLPWESGLPPVPIPAPSRGRHLAVLPLANISPDPGDAYFADGLTEELISTLSQVNGLSVIARTSVMPYKTAPKGLAQVGVELGVDSVLEGSVRKAGNRIRITLQLIDVATQGHIWATSYNRELDDVFAVQADIAQRTAGALRLEIAKAERESSRGRLTANGEAYDLYLRGLVAASNLSTGGYDEGVRCFERATQLDPQFAEAFASWSQLYVRASGDYVPIRDVMPKARELAARALELDPLSSEAHATLGNIAFQFDHDWPLAQAEFERAIALNPSNVNAHSFLGLLLQSVERFDEAKAELREVIRLDPAGGRQGVLVWAELESGNVDLAIATSEQAVAREPHDLRNHIYLGLTYLAGGRPADALQEADTPLGEGASYDDVFDHALLNALVGRPEAARAILSAWERGESKTYVSLTVYAMMYAAVGDKLRALDLLEQDDREGDQFLWLYYRGLFFDAIRDDPRFIALLRKYPVPVHPLARLSPRRS